MYPRNVKIMLNHGPFIKWFITIARAWMRTEHPPDNVSMCRYRTAGRDSKICTALALHPASHQYSYSGHSLLYMVGAHTFSAYSNISFPNL